MIQLFTRENRHEGMLTCVVNTLMCLLFHCMYIYRLNSGIQNSKNVLRFVVFLLLQHYFIYNPLKFLASRR